MRLVLSISWGGLGCAWMAEAAHACLSIRSAHRMWRVVCLLEIAASWRLDSLASAQARQEQEAGSMVTGGAQSPPSQHLVISCSDATFWGSDQSCAVRVASSALVEEGSAVVACQHAQPLWGLLPGH